mmetsp:Transcript_8740/g.34415  ORF Transcript_8740/g.34415 Transcript_8740/m.34415 type:complete len:397 (+) Transcript_8740:863-2053(+)
MRQPAASLDRERMARAWADTQSSASSLPTPPLAVGAALRAPNTPTEPSSTCRCTSESVRLLRSAARTPRSSAAERGSSSAVRVETTRWQSSSTDEEGSTVPGAGAQSHAPSLTWMRAERRPRCAHSRRCVLAGEPLDDKHTGRANSRGERERIRSADARGVVSSVSAHSPPAMPNAATAGPRAGAPVTPELTDGAPDGGGPPLSLAPASAAASAAASAGAAAVSASAAAAAPSPRAGVAGEPAAPADPRARSADCAASRTGGRPSCHPERRGASTGSGVAAGRPTNPRMQPCLAAASAVGMGSEAAGRFAEKKAEGTPKPRSVARGCTPKSASRAASSHADTASAPTACLELVRDEPLPLPLPLPRERPLASLAWTPSPPSSPAVRGLRWSRGGHP